MEFEGHEAERRIMSQGTHTKRAHPLALIGVRTFLELVRSHGVDPAFSAKAAMLLVSCGIAIPFRWLDNLVSSQLVARSPVPFPPLFIIGHWRSGTTHLHNLFSNDPQFGCLRGIHCFAARSFLGSRRLIQILLRPHLPQHRPMDNVELGLDRPQEDEIAMARIGTMSMMHGFWFPRRMREVFERWVTFDTATEKDIEAWKRTFDWMLRRVSIDEGGKPLCLKCPPHMARLAILREMFPGARFVHIYRNPHVVYHSNLKMWKALINTGALQILDEKGLEENLVYFYQRMLNRFFEDAHTIPENRLTHVRFEDLETDPIGQMDRIYRALELTGFDKASPSLAAYVARHVDYRKNTYVFDEDSRCRVEREWGFACSRWGYECPG